MARRALFRGACENKADCELFVKALFKLQERTQDPLDAFYAASSVWNCDVRKDQTWLQRSMEVGLWSVERLENNENYEMCIRDRSNYEARAELLLTASFAHNDTCRIGRLRLPFSGGGHNLERHLSGMFDTAHGAGLAVMMPALLQYLLEHDETTVAKIAQFANRVFDVEADPANPEEVAQKGIDRFRAWLKDLGMPATLHELAGKEVTDAHIDELMENVQFNEEGRFMGFGHCNRDDVRKIFESVR